MRLGTVRKNAVLTKDGVTINVRGKPSRFYPWGAGSGDVDETARALAVEAKGDALLAASEASEAQTLAAAAQLAADNAADVANNAASMAENSVKLTSSTVQTAGLALKSQNWDKAHATGDSKLAWSIGAGDFELYFDPAKSDTRDTRTVMHVENWLATAEVHSGNAITYADIDNNTAGPYTIGELFTVKGSKSPMGEQPLGVRRSMISTTATTSGGSVSAVSITTKVEHAAKTAQIIGKHSLTNSQGTAVTETVVNFITQTIDMTRTTADGTTETRSIDLWALAGNA